MNSFQPYAPASGVCLFGVAGVCFAACTGEDEPAASAVGWGRAGGRLGSGALWSLPVTDDLLINLSQRSVVDVNNLNLSARDSQSNGARPWDLSRKAESGSLTERHGQQFFPLQETLLWPLHKKRLIEFDEESSVVYLSPTGVRDVEQSILKTKAI